MKKDIIALMPIHKVFVEGFGGAGHVIITKEPSKIDIYNDINSGVCNFFSVLRDDNTSDKLIKKIQLTPYSREEFRFCKNTWAEEKDVVEKARKFYTTISQSVACLGNSSGWSYSKTASSRGMSATVSKWLGKTDSSLVDIVERLREIQIENLDIIDLINKYDSEDTLFYLDPPYVKETRKAKEVYLFEMSDEKHVELIDTLIEVKGKVILSGYDNDIYSRLLDYGWKKILLGEYTKTQSKFKEKGKEFVWINYEM